MKLLSLYESILNYFGVKVNEDGTTRISIQNQDEPATINGKMLVMPTTAMLSRGDDTTIVFHPLHEYINRGESPVVRKLRMLMNIRLNIAVMILMDKLLLILESPALQAQLDPQQRELIMAVGGGRKMARPIADGSPIREKLASIALKHFVANPDSFFMQLYLKKNGKLGGEKHNRIGVVTFPFHTFLDTAPGLTKEDKQIFHELLLFIFPDSDKGDESWNGFSDNTQCPWLDCLIATSSNLTDRMMELTRIYQDHLVDSETGTIPSALIFKDDWLDEMQNLGKYEKEILMIPAQSGNEGLSEKQEASDVAQALKSVDVNRQPVHQPVPVPAPATQQFQQPVQPAQQPLNYPPVGYPQGYQPGYPQQPVYQPPAIPQTADGKLDLGAAIPSPVGYQQGYQQPQQMPRQWAPTLGMPGQQAPMAPMGYIQPNGFIQPGNFNQPMGGYNRVIPV